MPVWGTGGSATVNLKATNNLDESSSTTFTCDRQDGHEADCEHEPLVRPALAMGFMLNTGDEALVVNLTNLTNAARGALCVALH